MNRCFKTPLVDAEVGGKRGGGARLTRLGAEVIERYRRVERSAARAAAADLRALTRKLAS
jgi:molybdate transport system regulatory protein